MDRIQKIIANSGYCSRRKAEELIENGVVKLNGKIVELGDKANDTDKITINDEPLAKQENKYYYILNKPKGILVTKEDPRGRKTIYDLLSMIKLEKKLGQKLNYVGRLDGMSEGLLILTNDGDFNNKLTHPKNHIEKTYLIRTEPKLREKDIERLRKGVIIDKRKLFAKISGIKDNEFHITIGEGRNRIIRKVMDKLGYQIFRLERISIGGVELGNVKGGDVRSLTENEINSLK